MIFVFNKKTHINRRYWGAAFKLLRLLSSMESEKKRHVLRCKRPDKKLSEKRGVCMQVNGLIGPCQERKNHHAETTSYTHIRSHSTPQRCEDEGELPPAKTSCGSKKITSKTPPPLSSCVVFYTGAGAPCWRSSISSIFFSRHRL